MIWPHITAETPGSTDTMKPLFFSQKPQQRISCPLLQVPLGFPSLLAQREGVTSQLTELVISDSISCVVSSPVQTQQHGACGGPLTMGESAPWIPKGKCPISTLSSTCLPRSNWTTASSHGRMHGGLLPRASGCPTSKNHLTVTAHSCPVASGLPQIPLPRTAPVQLPWVSFLWDRR